MFNWGQLIAPGRTEQETASELAGPITPALYMQTKGWLLANDPDAARMFNWAQRGTAPPADPQKLAFEVIWVILCAGRSAQAARTIERKVLAAITAGTPVVEVFGYRAKAAAIERAWREREADFAQLQIVLAGGDMARLIDWCGSIPYIGDDTKYQLAKNFSAPVCKPDQWMCRLAGIPDRPRKPLRERFAACQALASRIADATGDSVALVDSALWLACQKGVLTVKFEPHRVSFTPRDLSARASIFGGPNDRSNGVSTTESPVAAISHGALSPN